MAFCSFAIYTEAYGTNYDTDKIISDTSEYLISSTVSPAYGSVGGEWLVIGLARGSCGIPNGYYEKYCSSLSKTLTEKEGILHSNKYTEYSRVILALTAIGKNPYNISGFNLIEKLGEYDKVLLQGINGPIFALIALNSGEYTCNVADNTDVKQKYAKYITERQNTDGGFSLSEGGVSDIDVTAMALQALSFCGDDGEYKASIENGLTFLSENQLATGGFESRGEENCESCCQVIVALSALRVDIEDSRFVKNGNSVLDALMRFYSENGRFRHTLAEDSSSAMPAEQALYALAAYNRYKNGECSLYDMSDVHFETADGTDNSASSASVDAKNILFEDISDTQYEAEIIKLAEESIINGKSEKVFDPYAQMTRAEFATITVKAMGLTPGGNNSFYDVDVDKWYYDYISAAYGAGIIKGITETEFDPEGTITREQAAVMTARCAEYRGLPLVENINEINNILAQFDDYKTVSPWATSAVAFCCKSGCYMNDELSIAPQAMILRCEVAHMIYGLIKL